MLSLDTVLEGAKCDKLEEIVIDGDPENFFQIGALLPPQEKEELVLFLKRNIDVFAWSPYETLGMDPDFICYHFICNHLGVHLKSIQMLSRRR